MDYQVYQNPLTDRYASKEMSYNFSPQKKHSTWRRLWLTLAEAEKELGLDITDEQLQQMAAHLDDIDFDAVAAREKELRHDVMSHIHVFGAQCPAAMPIIHLGATSCYVTDNTELIQMRDGLKILRGKLLKLMALLADFALANRAVPTLGFTHYQPAQLTTVGKRFSLYLQDFLLDLEELEFELNKLPFRSVKGTTGTQASFLALFNGDHGKVKTLEKRVAARMGFDRVIDVSGQTYTRKIDYFVMAVLSGIAQSAYKMAGDIRLLANLREMEEPFGKSQIGSSAMAYKRNPMRSERVCSLARYVMTLPLNAAHTEATQWFERTLDDSANRRLVLAEGFLSVDVILSLLLNIVDGIQVWPNVIARRVAAELPFMATENILMAAVKAGGDRQLLHEAIRVHSMDAARRIKEEGGDNDLLDRIKADPAFAAIRDRIDQLVDPRSFVGRAPEQVEEFVDQRVRPLLARHAAELSAGGEAINV
ncbi:adenylosuccinate lyase [Victivallis sp. Marseille-Q1083]|uniref:adenylosuccinate lyase n=1 Tax=Victivallis sp. Marseille-Q1083 TaxID=2717288 RepID=UPI00158CB763|nr:adenylosuccinate lyase [Victivallis sp. Marseille-Q1083]